MEKKSEKGLMNEVLPDPSLAGDPRHGSPRERTVRHLRQIVAAAAGVGMLASGAAHADNSVPPAGGNAKPGGKETVPNKVPKNTPEPGGPGYWVVDPMPEPSRMVPRSPGHLSISSTPPGADILIDGAKQGVTPTYGIDVAPGHHVIELRLAGTASEVFSIEVKPNQSLNFDKKLRGKKPVPSKPNKSK